MPETKTEFMLLMERRLGKPWAKIERSLNQADARQHQAVLDGEPNAVRLFKLGNSMAAAIARGVRADQAR